MELNIIILIVHLKEITKFTIKQHNILSSYSIVCMCNCDILKQYIMYKFPENMPVKYLGP